MSLKSKRKVDPQDEANGFGEWGGYMNAKIAKLEEQFEADAAANSLKKESDIFAGISVFVNGYTTPSMEEIKRIIMVNGGTYNHYRRSTTDFTIAMNLPDTKIRQLTSEKVVHPSWITDSLKAKRVVDYAPYLLYTNSSHHSQPKLNFDKLPKTEQQQVDADIQKDLEILQKSLLVEKPREKSPTRHATKDATDPNFLNEFFQNSRLHHIATLGAGFKQYVNDLRERHKGGGFPARRRLTELPKMSEYTKGKRYIMHIDMDCFFVSVGLRNRPHLRGEPVAVTHSKGSEGGRIQHRSGANRAKEAELFRQRLDGLKDAAPEEGSNISKLGEKVAALGDDASSLSEIASCSYEARKLGVHNGMFVGSALKLCPNLKTIPYDFEEYREVAYTLYDTIASYTLDIEAVSCDEMFVDLSELLTFTQVDLMSFVGFIRDEVKTKTGCPCSAGIGDSKLTARLATKMAKPDGQHYLENALEYINKMEITELPGVGYSTSIKLEKLGLKTCQDLQALSQERLQLEFGKKFGETLYQFCRGIDARPLVYDHVRKSVSVDVNYGIRFTDNSQVETFLRQVCQELHKRMAEIRQKGTLLTLKILVRAKDAPVETAKYLGTGLCDAVNKSAPLPMPTMDIEIMSNAVMNLFWSMKLSPPELRGIGVQMSKLTAIGGKELGATNKIKDMFMKASNKPKIEAIPGTSKTVDPRQIVNEMSPSKFIEKISPQKKVGRPKKEVYISQTITKMFKEQKPVETNLDPEFLAALPDDIRKEVIDNHRRLLALEEKHVQKVETPVKEQQQQEVEDDEIITVDPRFLRALPPHLRKEVELEISLKKGKIKIEGKQEVKVDKNLQQEEKNLFLLDNFRSALESWIEALDEPSEEDIDLLIENAVELVERRELPALHIGLRCFHRLVSAKEKCKWHQAYLKVLNHVQFRMLDSTYGKKLDARETFEGCGECN